MKRNGILSALLTLSLLLTGCSTLLERGVTYLHGEGSFSGEEKLVLMCAFRQKQIVPLKALVHELDPEAFLIVCDAHEVLGQGFRRYQKNDV